MGLNKYVMQKYCAEYETAFVFLLLLIRQASLKCCLKFFGACSLALRKLGITAQCKTSWLAALWPELLKA
jgi:hypothetical protein